MKHRLVVPILAALCLAAFTASATDFGVRGGVYTKRSDAFVGAELLSHAGDDLYFDPNVEYVFTSGGQLWTFNFDGHYDLPTHGEPYLWVGGGLAVLYSKPDGPGPSDTSAHANILAGIGF